MDSNCNTGMMDSHYKVAAAAGSDTWVIRHVDFDWSAIWFPILHFTTLSTQNKNGALNKSYFQRKWSKNNKIEKGHRVLA